MQRVTIVACLLAVIGCRSEDKPKPPPPPIDGIELVEKTGGRSGVYRTRRRRA